MKLIEVKNLNKQFGDKKAINNLSFSIEKGKIFGFLGPSGSGKTTTINILTGQLSSDSGQSIILGTDSSQLKESDLKQIGLVTDTSGYYEKMTLYDNVLFFSKFFGINKSKVDMLLKRVGLYNERNTIAEKLSTGMRQRMLLVRALINNPKILFLDEPTSGLDPSTSMDIHELILELKEQGTTIFLTTHDMKEASMLCDDLILIANGKIIEQGTPSYLVRKYNILKKVNITYINNEEKCVSFEELKNYPNILIGAESIHSCEPTLEEIFINLTGRGLND